MRNYSALQLTSLAKQLHENAVVWYTRKDGWWLETDTAEEFLGCDSRGAYSKLLNIIENDNTANKRD